MLKTEDNPHGTEQNTFDSMTKEMKADRAKFWTAFFKQFYGVGMVTHPVSEEVLEWSANLAMRASLKATLDCAAAFATTDFRADLPHFRVPTLIIHGTGDKTVKIDATGRAAAAAIPGSTLLEYEGAPYGLFASHKQRFVHDVLNFVKTVDYQPLGYASRQHATAEGDDIAGELED